ncbi:MAG: hypothetical protein OXE52_09240 [Chloroflexi bacterium]|nr:hypothetical protein [Chloroflexota bacterium]
MAEQGETEATATLNPSFEHLATKADLAEFRGDIRTEMAEWRGELRAEHATLRGEMTTDNANLRSELKEEIANLRGELKDDIAALATKVGELDTRIDSIENQFTSLKWFIGILVTGASIVTSILVNLLARFIV